MRRLSTCLIWFSFLVFIPAGASFLHADDVTPGDTVTVVTPGVTARLCPQPMCGPDKHIMRIAEGTDLKVAGVEDIKIGTMVVTWFQVAVEGNSGWISIYDTDMAP